MPHINPDSWDSEHEQRKRDKRNKKRKRQKENNKRKRKDKW
jgi:hypothetical protein